MNYDLPYCIVKGCQSRTTTCLNKPHHCRNCGTINMHRMRDCEIARLIVSSERFIDLNRIPSKKEYMKDTTKLPKSDIAGAYVVKRDDKNELYLLIQQRATWLNGKLSTPGGEVNKGEGIIQAALRELVEESGLCTDIKFVKCFVPETFNSGKSVAPCLFEYSGPWNFQDESCARECDRFPTNIFGRVIHASHGHAWVKLTDLPYGFHHPNADKFVGKIPIKTIANIRKHCNQF